MNQELESITKFYDIVIEFITNYSFQILGAIIIFLIGIFVSKYVYKLVDNFLKTKIDETLSGFKFLSINNPNLSDKRKL